MQQLNSQNDRRANDREAPPVPTTVQLTLHEADGDRVIVGQILSISYSGLGIACNQPLSPGTKLVYTHPTRERIHSARIAWCKPTEGHSFEHGITNESFDASTRVDYYSVLQVSLTAEPCTIDAAYDFLCQRYHSGNLATANPLIFARLAEAYQMLSNPVNRTAYDLERGVNKNSGAAAKGERNLGLIKSKRGKMLELLYWRRVETPYKPVITLQEFEVLLKLPKDQLEFNLWFLRDNGYIARNDNACFVITALGVSTYEAVERPEGQPAEASEAPEEELEAVS